MFLGEYQHSLDLKGRVILPAKFRARFEPGLVLTKGHDSCLYVFPLEEWGRWSERLKDLRVSNKAARDFARLLFSGAGEDTPDRQGRVTIPEALRRYARLERDVTIIGAGTRVEVWQREMWEHRRSQMERDYSEMTESFPELPI